MVPHFDRDGGVPSLLDVLHWEGGVLGVLSDRPATVDVHANCVGAP